MSTQAVAPTRTTATPVITAAPAVALQRSCDCGQHTIGGEECDDCKQKKLTLHRRATSSFAPRTAPPIVHDVLRSSGEQLDDVTRAFMEARFGRDFGHVRIHRDARAADSANAVQAAAYAVGHNVVFGAGRYAPKTTEGRKLLAHELTHVVAQNGLVANGQIPIGPATDDSEREAEAQSERVAAEPRSHLANPSIAARPTQGAYLQRKFLGGAAGNAAFILTTTAAGALIGGMIGGGIGALIGAGIGLVVSGLISLIGNLLNRPPDKVQMVSGRYVGNVEGGVNNLREEVLAAMDRMHILWAMPNADYDVEYPLVSAMAAGSSVPKSSIPKTIAAIKRLADPTLNPTVARNVLDLQLSSNVGEDQPNNRADVLNLQDALHVDWNLTNDDYNNERTAVNAAGTPTISDELIPRTIAGISRMKTAFVAGAIRRDLFAGTHAVTPDQHAHVEHVLNPTTTAAGAPPPPMTGTGAGGSFETEMLDYLKNNVGVWGSEFRALKAESGQPGFPVNQANKIAIAAQGEVERYFGPYIRTASRGGPGEKYHPGIYSLVSKLGDESTRPITDAARQGWMDYWMTLRAPGCRTASCSQDILDAHNYYAPRDGGERVRVRDLYMATPANVTDIDDAIHGWPAEAGTGTVFLSPYRRADTDQEKRQLRWEVFTTLIHEMMHVVTHPNYARAADIIGGTGRKILIEGFAEVMRTELWSGPGQLEARLASPQMAPLRRQVEGKSYDYDASAVKDGPYYPQRADAQTIDAEVGHENAKAAFFLGHVELLGLGAGTSTETGASLAGIANYAPTDSDDAQVIVAVAGDSYSNILDRTGAAPGALVDDATGIALPVGAPIAAGTRVRVPGIRWVYAIAHDTLGTVAQQNHVTVAALAKANGFAAGAPATTPLVAGNRILIPIHQNLP